MTELLRKKKELDKCGGAVEIINIANEVITTSTIATNAEILRELYIRRQLIKRCGQIIEKAFGEEPIEEIIAESQQEIMDLTTRDKCQTVLLREPLDKVVNEDIEERVKNKGQLVGVTSGYKYLDTITAGFQKKDLIILAARPSMGKTTFALNIAENVAKKLDKPVVIFSLEMGMDKLAMKFLSSESRVSLQSMRTGYIADADWPKLANALARLNKVPIYINDKPDLTVNGLRAELRKFKYEHPDIAIAIIDYLQLMIPDKGRSRNEEVSDISRGLKMAAKEIGIPIIALSQLSRGVENRNEKRPQLSDLRDSGALEQDADVIMFLYRDDYYNPDTEYPNITELIVAKQRNGPLGVVKFYFDKECGKFVELERRQEA